MKKILFLFVCLAISIADIFARTEETRFSFDGFYFSPYAGWTFGQGNGLNAGLSAGYRFQSSTTIEIRGAYRQIADYSVPQMAFLVGTDLHGESRCYAILGVGAGMIFFEDKEIIPEFVWHFGAGAHIIKYILSISVEYNCEMLFTNRFEADRNILHGLSLNLKLTLGTSLIKSSKR